jgi:uncharacterized protein (DUF1778 family)
MLKQHADQEGMVLVLHDRISTIDERNSERMNFRLKPRVKKTIQQAAALSGVDDSAFALNAAYNAAIETIALHERTMLQPVDHAAFFDALDNPPALKVKLREAHARHKATIISK